METSPDVPDAFDQLALDETVNILVRSRHERRVVAPFAQDGLEPVDDGSSIVSRQDTSCTERLRPGDAAGDVVFEQRAVEPEGHAEIERVGIGCGVKAPRPQGHDCCTTRGNSSIGDSRSVTRTPATV